MLVRLPSPDWAHVRVAGTTGSGRTVLLRTNLSLALANLALSLSLCFSSERKWQGCPALVLVDPRGHCFRPFEGMPHPERSVIWAVVEATGGWRSLVHLMEKMATRVETGSGVIVVIDELADLLMLGGREMRQALTRLMQMGRDAGIRVIAAPAKLASAVLGPLLKANFPVRSVGRVTRVEDAGAATGRGGVGRNGRWGAVTLSVAEGRAMRLQVTCVSPDEIRHSTNGFWDVGSASTVSRAGGELRTSPP